MKKGKELVLEIWNLRSNKRSNSTEKVEGIELWYKALDIELIWSNKIYI